MSKCVDCENLTCNQADKPYIYGCAQIPIIFNDGEASRDKICPGFKRREFRKYFQDLEFCNSKKTDNLKKKSKVFLYFPPY